MRKRVTSVYVRHSERILTPEKERREENKDENERKEKKEIDYHEIVTLEIAMGIVYLCFRGFQGSNKNEYSS